ncbi:MAG TPA: tripartite tricarboxylate transporter substrate-binding protein [Candidatus Saccharimonadales bacterium]|nr:tripartite tricarboxylate transporter substrate-binding protein [Candidatus Saccharimonadales bacterium]
MRKFVCAVSVTFNVSLLFGGSLVLNPALNAQSNFFQGKSVRVIRGGQPGDLYDLWTRHIATYLGKHIPGNPSITVQNMPGAGSVIAANYVYNISKPDGLTLGSLNPGIYMDQLIGRKEVQYDWAKFNWLGTPEQTESVVFFRGDSPYKTIDDLRKATEPPKCGSTGTASTTYHIPKLIEEVFGVKFNIITGYQGAGDIDLAVERGELQCRLITIAAFFGREPHITWFKKGFTRAFVQTGRKRDPLLPETPTFYDLMDRYKSRDAERRLATLVMAPNEFGRPWTAPPGMADDRLKILREAWLNTLADPELVAEAKKRNWPVEPVGGERLAALAKEVIAQPPDVVVRLKKLLAE